MHADRPASWPKFTRFRGDSKRLCFVLTDDNDNVLRPDDHEMYFEVERADGTPLIQKQKSIGGFVVTDNAAGKFEIALVPEDDAALEDDLLYNCAVVAQHLESGAIHRLRATLKVVDGVMSEPALTIDTHTTEAPVPLLRRVAVPASSTAPGTANTYAFDAENFYLCIVADTWRRFPLNDWE